MLAATAGSFDTLPMSDLDLPALPEGSRSITSYHAHIYWATPEQRQRAMHVRGWLAERFIVQLGSIHDRPVGPHVAPMYQVPKA